MINAHILSDIDSSPGRCCPHAHSPLFCYMVKQYRSFSSLLQWCIKTEQRTQSFDLTTLLLTYVDNLQESDLASRLKMIVTDEFVWAFLEKEYFVSEKAIAALHSAFQVELNEYEYVNLFFTLVWHNRWMMKPAFESSMHIDESATTKQGCVSTGLFSRPVSHSQDWLARYSESATALLVDADRRVSECEEACLAIAAREPDCLDDNLGYHWHHFVTQRAAWHRDWCFQDDPGAFEVIWTQITEGSANAQNHQRLVKLALVLIEQATPRRLRDVLFLVASRRGGLPAGSLGKVCDAVDARLKVGRDAGSLQVHILVALFELYRQGLMWSDEARSVFATSKQREEDREFMGWCRQFAGDGPLAKAWQRYYIPTVRRALLRSDLRPDDVNGWKLFREFLFRSASGE